MAEFKRDLEWVERLDVTLGPVPEVSGPQSTPQNKDQKAVDPEDDFQREMNLYVFKCGSCGSPCFKSGEVGKVVRLYSSEVVRSLRVRRRASLNSKELRRLCVVGRAPWSTSYNPNSSLFYF